MIKGTPKKAVKFENILDKVDPYYIYRYYLGDFTTKRNINSPFRTDDHPSFRVKVATDGTLFHKDYGDATKAGNCINLVQQLFGLSYVEAIHKVEHDFGLRKSEKEYKRIVEEFKKPANLKEKEPNKIHIDERPFNKDELLYWEEYEIDEWELKRENVYGIKNIWKNDKIVIDPTNTLKFAYYYDPTWKVYRPHEQKNWKWIWNNTPNDRMYGLENLKGAKKGIVTKSHKDYLCLRSVFPATAMCQNESEVAVNQVNIEYLQQNCDEVYFFFDCDEVGRRSCKFYNQFGFKWVNVPNKYYQESKTKDASDLVKNYGLGELVKLLKAKNII